MKKKSVFIIIAQAVMLLLTAVCPLTMNCFAGAGLLYHSDSYGRHISFLGILLIASGISMTAGAILSLRRSRAAGVTALVLSLTGLAVCLYALFALCAHADAAGWTRAADMTPASDMYKLRILPCIIPAVMAAVSGGVHIRPVR